MFSASHNRRRANCRTADEDFCLTQCLPDGGDAEMSRWILAFAAPTFEQDFNRFRSRGANNVAGFYMLFSVVVDVLAMAGLFPIGTLVLNAVALGVSVVATAVFVAFVWCQPTPAAADIARQLMLHYRLQGIFMAFNVAFIVVKTLTWLGEYERCLRTASGPYGNGGLCPWEFVATPSGYIMLMHVFNIPLLHVLAAWDVLTVCIVLALMPTVGSFTAVDYATVLVFLGGVVAIGCGYTRGVQVNERNNFVEQARLLRANHEIKRLSAVTRAMVEVGLPRELLHGAAAVEAQHHSPAATVGVCDIADFATWSCTLLITDVVVALHSFATLVALGTEVHAVARIMSYGDSNVVCAGLLSACDDHAARVRDFGTWLLSPSRADDTNDAFAIRVGVATGAVTGRLLGEAAQRYAVTGSAYDAAKVALTSAAAGELVVSTLMPAAKSPSGSQALEPAVIQITRTPVTDASDEHGNADDSLKFSAVWLTFVDEEARDGMAAFVEARFLRDRKGLGAIPVAVAALGVCTSLLERAALDPRRHHTDPLVLGALYGALLLSAAGLLVRLLTTRLPLAVEHGMAAAVHLAVMVARVGCVVGGGNFVVVPMGIFQYYPHMPWVAQAAIQLVTLLLPVLFEAVFYRGSETVAAWFILFAMLTVLRYIARRRGCQQFIAETVAARAVATSEKVATAHDALLAGLIPAHAIPVARSHHTIMLAQSDDALMSRFWKGLSVLEVALRVPDVEALPASWALVATTLATFGAAGVELAESTGDAFLVAGPFDHSACDEMHAATAHATVALIRALHAALQPTKCAFTAVATAGNAYGSLMGAYGLVYRLFGPVVRESNAVLAAAPALETSAAFATESFRQQHGNFGVSARPTRHAGFGMSHAVPESIASSRMDSATDQFGAATNWRMRAVGVTRVSVVRLARKPGAASAATSWSD
jgi:class 3 adenylate cyclase